MSTTASLCDGAKQATGMRALQSNRCAQPHARMYRSTHMANLHSHGGSCPRTKAKVKHSTISDVEGKVVPKTPYRNTTPTLGNLTHCENIHKQIGTYGDACVRGIGKECSTRNSTLNVDNTMWQSYSGSIVASIIGGCLSQRAQNSQISLTSASARRSTAPPPHGDAHWPSPGAAPGNITIPASHGSLRHSRKSTLQAEYMQQLPRNMLSPIPCCKPMQRMQRAGNEAICWQILTESSYIWVTNHIRRKAGPRNPELHVNRHLHPESPKGPHMIIPGGGGVRPLLRRPLLGAPEPFLLKTESRSSDGPNRYSTTRGQCPLNGEANNLGFSNSPCLGPPQAQLAQAAP